MLKRIKLMPDYDCFPLWEMDDIGEINPNELPLSQETINRLMKWKKIYDKLLNVKDPASSDFVNEDERIAFEKEGIYLWKQLQKELENQYKVYYRSELQNKLLRDFSEIKEVICV